MTNQQIATRIETPSASVYALESIRELEDRFAVAVRQRELLADYIKERLTPGKHFYRVKGSKNSLTKEGAELICLPHSYRPGYVKNAGPDAPPEDKQPYQIIVTCRLMKTDGSFAGEGMGSASSYQTTKTGEYQPRQKDPGLCHNATLKMAQKSAYIAATLNATAASEFFTQDIESDEAGEADVKPTTPKDNRYMCPEHKVEWFKKGKMKGYAHPIGDSGNWCNMKDFPLDDEDSTQNQPSEAPEPVQSQPEAQRPLADDAGAVPASGGELLTRAVNELGYKGRAEIFKVLKVASILEVKDIGAAWQALKEEVAKF